MSGREAEIEEALVKCACGVDRRGPGRWAFVLSNGTELAVGARVADGWLSLDAPLAGPSPDLDPWELLRRNATLAGGARFALAGADRGLRLRADVALDDDVDVRARVVEACAGFKAAGEPACGFTSAGADVDLAGKGLEDLCEETSWEFVARERRVAVTLEVPGAYQQAMVESRGGAGVAVTVPVVEAGTARPTDICAQAAGVLLLRVCGVVRLVRAAGSVGEDADDPRFEVLFRSRPDARELGHAFGALSLACRLAAREAALVWGDESVARAYLEHWRSGEGGI